MTGRMYSERAAAVAFWLIVVGFNLTFFVQFVMGSKGMPRRYYDYPPEFAIYHQISSLGSYVMAVGFVVALVYLLQSLYRGRPAPGNPWGGNSLEWHTPSPPPHDNFAETPVADDPYDFRHWRWDPAVLGWVKKQAT
jgi:cytochrome c oxidase subunit 1